MNEQITLSVPSHPKYLYVVRSALYPFLREAGFSVKDTRKIVLATDEACSNIIKYAYEGNPDETIALVVSLDGSRLRIEIRDSGIKPDVSRIAPRKLDDIRPGGLGTHIMASVFDKVEYDVNSERGTVLTLTKERSSQPTQ